MNHPTVAQLYAVAFLMLAVLAGIVALSVAFLGLARTEPLEFADCTFSDAIGVAVFGLFSVGAALVLA